MLTSNVWPVQDETIMCVGTSICSCNDRRHFLLVLIPAVLALAWLAGKAGCISLPRGKPKATKQQALFSQ